MNLKVKAVLDPQFEPMALKVREMREKTAEEGQEIVIGVERDRGAITTYRTRIFPDGTNSWRGSSSPCCGSPADSTSSSPDRP